MNSRSDQEQVDTYRRVAVNLRADAEAARTIVLELVADRVRFDTFAEPALNAATRHMEQLAAALVRMAEDADSLAGSYQEHIDLGLSA